MNNRIRKLVTVLFHLFFFPQAVSNIQHATMYLGFGGMAIMLLISPSLQNLLPFTDTLNYITLILAFTVEVGVTQQCIPGLKSKWPNPSFLLKSPRSDFNFTSLIDLSQIKILWQYTIWFPVELYSLGKCRAQDTMVYHEFGTNLMLKLLSFDFTNNLKPLIHVIVLSIKEV